MPTPSLPPLRQLLFVCSQNRWRSLTAERLFDDHPHLLARSAGTEPGARVRVAAGHLGWADVIFVMEKKHADRLRAKFGSALHGKPIINLRIPDDYQFQDPALVALLHERLRAYFGTDVADIR
ncbi:protein tyrosine phosphatase [Hymenobacter sp. UV11]|uniref:low molecular weight protein tyrosine phosphatase family protein n=1 Tax=Hymenobacter sp. UV11 TaxID=1849735 RepID=UPI0010620513|nr:protein tyrosine phosphatase [Hymenobacter sp. UV11]TDN40410.1 protein tyrosine phosphatase [Hymenobacter sp. UV11]TFZ66587.1 protein tyrosine phosphatase [Hymenobacter sp. UV11]